MKVNKINFLIISLFLNNIKSTKLMSTHQDGIYRYQDKQISTLKKLSNESDTEYNTRRYIHVSELPSNILESFITEMRNIPNDSTFYIEEKYDEDNFFLHQYTLTNKENLISIKRNFRNLFSLNPNLNPNLDLNFNPNHSQYDINYTVLALSYTNQIQSFLIKNATIDSDCPNSDFYIHENDCLAIDTINSSYYIFRKNDITIMKNREGVRSLFNFEEEKTITCYDKCKIFSRDWMPTLSVITAIVVPLVGKKIKQE